MPPWLWNTVPLRHACPGKPRSRLLCCCQPLLVPSRIISGSKKIKEEYTSLLSSSMGGAQLTPTPAFPSLAGLAVSPIPQSLWCRQALLSLPQHVHRRCKLLVQLRYTLWEREGKD